MNKSVPPTLPPGIIVQHVRSKSKEKTNKTQPDRRIHYILVGLIAHKLL